MRKSTILSYIFFFLIITFSFFVNYKAPEFFTINVYVITLILLVFPIFINWGTVHQSISVGYFLACLGASVFLRKEILTNNSDILEVTAIGVVLGIVSVISTIYKNRRTTSTIESNPKVIRKSNESESDYLDLIENCDMGIFRSTPEGKIIFYNDAFQKILGYSDGKDLKKININKEIYASETEREQFQKLLDRQGKLKKYRISLKKKNGALLTVRISGRVVKDEKENPKFYECNIFDITQQAKRDKESKQRIEKLKAENLKAIGDAKKAVQRNNIKTRFLASMSHEIRTPMNSVLGFLTLIENELFENKEELKQFASNAHTSAESLLDIINNILDISKIEAGKMELDDAEFNFQEQVNKSESIISPNAKEKGISLVTDLDPELPRFLIGDPTRFRQILVNLLGNAVKFTEEGEVRLNLRLVEADEINIRIYGEVVDTGPGIPEDKIEKLFKPYSQVKGDSPVKNQGAGLGLMICKEFVNLMGGDIGVKSEFGKGSTFYFEINFQPSPNENMKVIRKAPVNETVETEPEPKEEENELAAFSNFPKNPRSKKRLLLVEDNPISQSVELKLLREVGYLVDPVTNGKDAVEAVKTGAFDLVLMDIEMVEMDGITATKKIRELEGEVSKVPIIAVTANSSMKDRERCLDASMNDYIAKPININFLKMTIDRWLEG